MEQNPWISYLVFGWNLDLFLLLWYLIAICKYRGKKSKNVQRENKNVNGDLFPKVLYRQNLTKLELNLEGWLRFFWNKL